jgi:hypothetical protein
MFALTLTLEFTSPESGNRPSTYLQQVIMALGLGFFIPAMKATTTIRLLTVAPVT